MNYERYSAKREAQAIYESTLFDSTEITKTISASGKPQWNISVSPEKHTPFTTTLLPTSDLARLDADRLTKLSTEFHREFIRPGAHLIMPETGWVAIMQSNNTDFGFYFYGEPEVVATEMVPQLYKKTALGDETQQLLIPDRVHRSINAFIQDGGDVLSADDLSHSVLRPMRFLIYPEAQGGNLKRMMGMMKITSTLLAHHNTIASEKDAIFEVIEARAGISNHALMEQQTYISSKPDHYLLDLYLAKGLNPLTVDNTMLYWETNPYYNFSMARTFLAPALLSSIWEKN